MKAILTIQVELPKYITTEKEADDFLNNEMSYELKYEEFKEREIVEYILNTEIIEQQIK